jgi:hypothetical protein
MSDPLAQEAAQIDTQQTMTQEAGAATPGEQSAAPSSPSQTNDASAIGTEAVAASVAGEPGNAQAPTSGSPGSGDEHPHTPILRKLVELIRRDFNMLGGELESWVATAERHL